MGSWSSCSGVTDGWWLMKSSTDVAALAKSSSTTDGSPVTPDVPISDNLKTKNSNCARCVNK